MTATDRTGSPNPGQRNIVQTGTLQAADVTGIAERKGDESRRKRTFDARLEQPGSDAASLEQADQDSGAPSSPTSNDTSTFSVSASVIRRQRNDPELREQIHKLETDFWANRISREVYNEERLKLYTTKEINEACIVWPRQEVQSPAGYRENELEYGNHRAVDAQILDDLLFEYGCLFDEVRNGGGDEEAAKKRLMDEIERKFRVPGAKMAEYKRWEKIKELETEYYHDRVDRKEYNERRFALYTEE